ncbi:MAG: hypothetical protein GF398_10650 [Chitinivibrionales bacterium]|nr:hypothetical protein [Chitinivibrionales bacterium]
MPATEAIYLDEVIDKAVKLCCDLPASCNEYTGQIAELSDRLAQGKLHFAVLGQFNRGKSTFLNALLGARVLPTSVLPLTSVPTVIKYGGTCRCTINFADNKESLTEWGSPAAVKNQLETYVTEKNNPENKFNVSDVTVECANNLLRNGTVLIDTPGFGSTYLHNTATTVNMLNECDAVFFLLSADLPITQAEVEFLKEVRKFVPRIFFIFNKVDMISADDYAEVERFINEVIVEHFGVSTDVKLFPICAKKAEAAIGVRHPDNDQEDGGLAQVKDALFDFIMSEKFFVLSRALIDKFKDAIGNITSLLVQERTSRVAPIEQLRQKRTALGESAAPLKDTTDKELRMVAVERDAIAGCAEKALSVARARAEQAVSAFLAGLLKNPAAAKTHPAALLQSTYPAFAAEQFDALAAATFTAAARPFSKTLAVHVRQFQVAAETVNDLLGEQCATGDQLEALLENLEITAPQTCRPIDATRALQHLPKSFGDRFVGRHKRYDTFRDRYLPVVSRIFIDNCESVRVNFHQALEAAFLEVAEILSVKYASLHEIIVDTLAEYSRHIEELEGANEPVLNKLDKLLQDFSEIKKSLV